MARAPSTAPLNFIVFGDMGVGKILFRFKIRTLESTEYTITISPQLNVKLFDTVGLNNVTMNDRSYLDALVKAHKLIVSLQNQGGNMESTQQNYRLFHEFLCQEKVPLALVITNLENEENMDDWWIKNQADIKEYGIAPVTQACITTIRGLRNVYEDKYLESRKKMCDMLDILGRGDACSAIQYRSGILNYMAYWQPGARPHPVPPELPPLILQLVTCPTHDPEEPGQGAPINGATATAAVILRALSGTQTCALALVASPNQSRVYREGGNRSF
ncbi:hypothetical protein EDB19DRAFT_1833744 [Suillus lakei]|nr:hypothetical protein EDB19DRAFT_1833744 [Suillus lakei]